MKELHSVGNAELEIQLCLDKAVLNGPWSLGMIVRVNGLVI